MAIVFFVSDGYRGFGDFLFAAKTVKALDTLRQQNPGLQILVVSQASGIDKLKSLQLLPDNELLSIEEFNNLNLHVNCYIEGPIFNPRILPRLKIPLQTPVILLPEYSLPSEALYAQSQYRIELKTNPIII